MLLWSNEGLWDGRIAAIKIQDFFKENLKETHNLRTETDFKIYLMKYTTSQSVMNV
jgi:hypothetical protein